VWTFLQTLFFPLCFFNFLLPPSYYYTFISFFPPHCIEIENGKKKCLGRKGFELLRFFINLHFSHSKFLKYFKIKKFHNKNLECPTHFSNATLYRHHTVQGEKRRKWEHNNKIATTILRYIFSRK
jgi:hypothetical protein